MRILFCPIQKLITTALFLGAISLSAQDSVTVVNEAVINTPFQEYSPAFFPNGLVFIASNPAVKTEKKEDDITGKATTSIFFSARNAQGLLDAPKAFAEELTTKYYDGPLSFNASGSVVYFTRSNNRRGKPIKSKDGLVKLKIYSAEKKAEKWGMPVELPFNNSEYDCAHPSVSPDGRRLYFSSNRPGGFGGMDLYVSTLLNGKWSDPVNLGPKVNTDKNEIFPFIHEDGKVYFSSNGHKGIGNLDILYTQKTDTGWLKPRILPEPINSHSDDFGLIMSLDKKSGYFSSNRASGKGDDDIFSFNLLNVIDSLYPKVEFEISPELLSGGSNEFTNDVSKTNDAPSEKVETPIASVVEEPKKSATSQSETPKITVSEPSNPKKEVAVMGEPKVNKSSADDNFVEEPKATDVAISKPSTPTVKETVQVEKPISEKIEIAETPSKISTDNFDEGFASEKPMKEEVLTKVSDEKKDAPKENIKINEAPKKSPAVISEAPKKQETDIKDSKKDKKEPAKAPVLKDKKNTKPVIAEAKPQPKLEEKAKIEVKPAVDTTAKIAEVKIQEALKETKEADAPELKKTPISAPQQPNNNIVMNASKPKKNAPKESEKQEVKKILLLLIIKLKCSQ